MRTWKSRVSSFSMSRSSTEKKHSPSGIRLHLKAILSFICLAAVCLALSVGTFAWYYTTQKESLLLINTEGIKLDASLYYVEELNFLTEPAETDYVLQDRGSVRNITGECYAGSRLAYKMTVKNRSNEEDPHSTTVTSGAGKNLDISISFSEFGRYFDELIELYEADPDDGEIYTVIRENNGGLLLQISSIDYLVTNSAGTVKVAKTAYTITPAANVISAQFAMGESFFTYESLAPGDTLTIYFKLTCISPRDASDIYEAYRQAQLSDLSDLADTYDVGSTEYLAIEAKINAIDAIYRKELRSMVIEKGSSSSVTASAIDIKHISVYAAVHY